jgi:hypothetical protein
MAERAQAKEDVSPDPAAVPGAVNEDERALVSIIHEKSLSAVIDQLDEGGRPARTYPR